MYSFENQNARTVMHIVPWFGQKNHVPLLYTMADGSTCFYDSSNLKLLNDQCNKMLDMRVFGINVDYYGPNDPTTFAIINMLATTEKCGLGFSICIDHNGISASSDPTQQYIDSLEFCRQVFFASPNYIEDNGRKLVTFFEKAPNTDWAKVRKSLSVPCAFVFNGNRFTDPESDGAFGWVNPVPNDPTNINEAAIDSFVGMAKANPSKIAMYPVYPGFDDSLASWTGTPTKPKRFMTRALDRTFKTTLSKVPADAKWIMAATWNDHEEGTGLETGVWIS